MSATKLILCVAVACLLTGVSTAATAKQRKPWKVEVTEEAEPDSKAWEDPARLAFTIDPHGPDEFSAQVNLDLKLNLTPQFDPRNFPRERTAGGYVRWNRETGGDRQNNFELGATFEIGHDFIGRTMFTDEQLDRLSAEELTEINDKQARVLDLSFSLSSGYARTAVYADTTLPVCTSAPAFPQCRSQHKESIRSGLQIGFLNPHLQGRAGRGLFYTVEPKVTLDHDLLLNSPVDPATGERSKGGYLSGVGGLALAIAPSFIDPGWELKASGQVRQRIASSGSRKTSIEGTAEQFEVSATYYFLRPVKPVKDGWRAGLGVVYSHGGDPLTGEPDEDRIVLALKLGRY